MHETLGSSETDLTQLAYEDLVPGAAALEMYQRGLR